MGYLNFSFLTIMKDFETVFIFLLNTTIDIRCAGKVKERRNLSDVRDPGRFLLLGRRHQVQNQLFPRLHTVHQQLEVQPDTRKILKISHLRQLFM
jgi:hypothetical protein